MTDEIRQANLIDRLRYRFGRLKAVEVEGNSMLPTLRDGDIVLVDPNASLKEGDLALADHPYKSSVRIIKRIAAVGSDGTYELIGDNPAESTDSRTFGLVSIKSIKGLVVCRFK